MSEEVWRPVPEYPGYEVSDRGQVRSFRSLNGIGPLVDRPRVLRQKAHSQTGYMMVKASHESGRRRKVHVHQLVAAAFIGPCPGGHQVAHNDGSKLNNAAGNLRYATPYQNSQDKHQHGTVFHARGERCGAAKITEAAVVIIKEMRLSGTPLKQIAAIYGLDISHVCAITKGRKWAHVGPTLTPPGDATRE